MATLSFLGATGTVTGSRFLLSGDHATVLLDGGLFQGLKALRLRNWDSAGIPVRELDAIVLSHAHLDHCGYLPALVAQGYGGPIYCTAGTAALAEIVLRDSAKLQQEDAAFANKHGFSKHANPRALYDVDDVERMLPLLNVVPFDSEILIADGVSVRFGVAGHVLGSSSTLLTVDGVSVLASGDLGRPSHPLLRPPVDPPQADVVLIESTYGNREHPNLSLDPFADAITRTIRRGGNVVIPAFAVDRTEVLLMALRELIAAGRIPRVPIFVDSPMALRTLAVYRDAIRQHEPDIRPDIVATPDPFDPGTLHEAATPDESRAINSPAHASIIISASGMATGGRVLHHLKALLPDPRNTVILAGFQAAGTRGRDLFNGATEIKIHGEYVPVRAEIVNIGSFSVHADANELLGWLAKMPQAPTSTYVVHGEPDASEALRQRIASELRWHVTIPHDRDTVTL
jgi:metallo-beta-lactamase family protein